MRRLLIGCVFSLCVGSMFASRLPADDDEQDFVAVFDGKSLAGWEGAEEVFRVIDGAIVGGSLQQPLARNEFLCTREEYADFELRLKFKLAGQGVNGGVQIRSQRIPNDHEVRGYQADLGDGYWGSLYDESRRNKILAAADPAMVKAALKRDDWNDYKIRCEGRRIRLWINGVATVDYFEDDESLPQSGIIGLQIHAGGPSTAAYKDLRIKKLDGPSKPATK